MQGVVWASTVTRVGKSVYDGGVLYTNVPAGTYTLTAHESGVEFESVTVRCEAGVLVNPSPPYGLQAL